MNLKNLFFAFSFLFTITLNAQTDSSGFDNNGLGIPQNYSQDLALLSLDLSAISKAYVLENSANNFEGFNLLDTTASPDNFMLLEAENREALEGSLNAMLMRRHPMEKTGRILTYIGVPLAIIGGIMVAGADELYYNCVNGNCTGDARGGFGVVALAAGVGLSGTGGVLWIIGSKKR